jgi:hypothetical protein
MMKKRIRLDEEVLIDVRGYSGAALGLNIALGRSRDDDDGRYRQVEGGADRQSRAQVIQPKLLANPYQRS